MANEATLSLKLDLNALKIGFTAALQMGQNFAGQFNKLLAGQGKIDLKSFDKQLQDYEAKLKAASGETLDVNEKPAIDGLDKTAKAADAAGKKIRSENLQNAASFAQVVTGIQSAISLLTQLVQKINSFQQAGIEAEQAQLGFVEALKQAGLYTPEYAAELTKIIDQTMKWSGVSDENIKSQVKMALNIHKFSKEEMPDAINAAVGLSKVFDTDLRNAFQMLARSAEGLPVRLAQYGISVKGAEDATMGFTQLMQKGAEGADQLKVAMDSASGTAIRQKVSFGELWEKISELTNTAIQPLVRFLLELADKWRENDAMLKTVGATLALVGTAVLTFLGITKLLTAAVKIAAFWQSIWNATLTVNPIVFIITAVAVLAVGIAYLSKNNEEFGRNWNRVWKDSIAWIMAAWEMVKGFGIFVINFAGAMAMSLAYPFKQMYDIAVGIFSKLAAIMRKLFSGDFKGVWEEINAGIKTRAAENAQAVVAQYLYAFEELDKVRQKTDVIWSNRYKLNAVGLAAGVQKTVTVGDQSQTGVSVVQPQSPEEIAKAKAEAEALAKAKAAANEEYYNTLKWQAADYEQFMTDKYTNEAMAFLTLTNDQEKADALLTQRLKELAENKAAYEKQLRDDAIKAERAPFEAARTTIEEHLKRLENWKALGLNVSDDLKKTWGDYFSLLKGRMKESEKAYQDASSGKVVVSEEELARLKAVYELDYDNYLSSLDKKKQADLQAVNAIIAKWEENHQFAVKSINGIKAGFGAMWDSILDKQMTGRQRADAIWKGMLQSWKSSLGDYIADYGAKQIKLVLMHTMAEKAKTAVTTDNEATRATIHKATVMEQIALDIWAGIKFVAIKLWETAAALTKFYSFLGPLAPIAAAITMATAVIPMVMAFRKGFKKGLYTGDGDPNEIAGAVHKKEFVVPADATEGNLGALYAITGFMKKGYKLADLLLPNISIPWAPVPQVAYSFAGGGQATGDMEGMVRKAVRAELSGLQMTAEVSITDRMLIVALRWLEKGKKLMNRLG